MSKSHYIYQFRAGAALDEVNDLLFLAALAAECLYGRSSLRLDGTFTLDREKRQCVVNAATQVGQDLARIFTGFLGHQIGEKTFQVRYSENPEPAMVEGGVQ